MTIEKPSLTICDLEVKSASVRLPKSEGFRRSLEDTSKRVYLANSDVMEQR